MRKNRTKEKAHSRMVTDLSNLPRQNLVQCDCGDEVDVNDRQQVRDHQRCANDERL